MTGSFDVCGPLPSGVTVLEASAGTGKTYTIAALAARYVAQGTPLERLLLVTFTRMATGELRERVRDRLLGVGHGLERVRAGLGPGGDEVVALLGRGSPPELELASARIARALAHFDGARIATTHGFCQEVLDGLGVAGDLEADVTFVEDIGELLAEVVDDLYIRRFQGGDAPPFGRAQAAEIARVVVAHPGAPLAAAGSDLAQMRRRLALAVREELERRKRALAMMTYDDLLTRLHAALDGEDGAGVAARLRARYDVVLVDEFQDTDPVQWSIVRRAFGDGGTTLVLIGDPKQAIYAFRGADVYAYLAAARSAGRHATLDVNWRSDQGLIEAYDAFFAGARLGHPGIEYRRVRACPAHRSPRISGAPCSTPLRVRVLDRDDPAIKLTRGGFAGNASAREQIAADLAADLVGLLRSEALIDGRDTVAPEHVAVLVRTNRHAALIRGALDRVGVPAVINGAGSVFATAPAGEWLRLLEAIERPASPTRARSAALTCFLGWPAARVAAAGDDDWGEVHRRLHDWARVLRVDGVASLVAQITLVEGLPERILWLADGERRLTDLRHVGELLHAVASAEQLGTAALTAWLARRIAGAEDDTGNEERSRRLESDAAAVQVLTIHRSKGLEFPIVYLPFLWEPGYIPREPRPVCFHDRDAGDTLTIDVGLDGPDFARHREQSVVEARGEDLRLAYVALTRARHQAVLWWAGSWDSRNSALGRLLFARDGEGNIAAAGDFTPADAAVHTRLAGLAGTAPGAIAVEHAVLDGAPARWSPPAGGAVALDAASFRRVLDRHWRRTSYSDITAGTYEARVATEPEAAGVLDDEPGAASRAAVGNRVGVGAGAADLLAAPSLWRELPVGAEFGTLVHHVLEATDFAAADLPGELDARIAAALAWRRVEIGDPALLRDGLAAAISTPLGPLLDGLRLRDLARRDRLDELGFELPLGSRVSNQGSPDTVRASGAGGPAAPAIWAAAAPPGVALASIGAVLRAHPGDADPLAGYAARLDDPALRQHFGGYLTGSLDLVVRVVDAAGEPRFAVIDYKTNWLGPPDDELTARHHRPAALAAEMREAHYGLQALLYSVALHRYLRWRLPGYAVERHLAGVVYLFLRGMSGPATPLVDGTPCGVFAWRPPPGLVAALSDVLDGGV